MTSAAVPRILLVDDESDITGSIQRLFEVALPRELPREVLVANSALDAIEAMDRLARERLPLLVISDFNMGGELDGLQLLEEIGNLQPEARLVLLSGYPPEDFEDRPEYRLVYTFLRKPFEIATLRDLATEFLRSAS